MVETNEKTKSPPLFVIESGESKAVFYVYGQRNEDRRVYLLYDCSISSLRRFLDLTSSSPTARPTGSNLIILLAARDQVGKNVHAKDNPRLPTVFTQKIPTRLALRQYRFIGSAGDTMLQTQSQRHGAPCGAVTPHQVRPWRAGNTPSAHS